MSHGGIPARRPDQLQTAPSQATVPGARKSAIVNATGAGGAVVPVVVQDGGIPGAQSVQGYAADGITDILLAAGVNVRGIKLWSASLSSWVGTGSVVGVNQTDDQLVDGAGNIYMSLTNGVAFNTGGGGSSSPASVGQELHGIIVPAGRSLKLVNGSTGTTHRTSATVIYTIL